MPSASASMGQESSAGEEAGLERFACPCLNVIIDVAAAAGASIDAGSSAHGRGRGDRQTFTLQQSIVIAPGRIADIKIAQPPLTVRSQGHLAFAEAGEPLTTVTCLACGNIVYGVDKPAKTSLSAQQARGASSLNQTSRTVGFAEGQMRNGFQSAQYEPVAASSINDTASTSEIVRPHPTSGSLWLFEGCVIGADAVGVIQSSPEYSRSYGIVIANKFSSVKAEREERRNERRPSGARRLLSPDGQIKSRAARSLASPSPSPARRRRQARSLNAEEEDGEDIDMLHLIDTILPRLPTSILLENINGHGESQGMSFPSAARAKSPMRGFPSRPLESHLDSVAIKRLQELKSDAQRQVYELIKQKSSEYVALEQELKVEARSLSEMAHQSQSLIETHPRGGQDKVADDVETVAEMNSQTSADSPLFPRRKPHVPLQAAPSNIVSSETQASRDPGVSRSVATAAGGGSMDTTNMQPGPVVGSYLSASFAMRGRDLPAQVEQHELSQEDEEEWFAAKRRLRERYPYADHSALPSAVNSDDEGMVQTKKNVEANDEDAPRGRERGRTSGGREERSREGRRAETRSASGERGRVSDSRAKAETDVGPGSLQKKGALKTPSNSGDNARTPTSSIAEKRVAFASVNEEVEAAQPAKEEMEESAEHNSDEALFEIDEDVEREDLTPNSSEITIDQRKTPPAEGQEEVSIDEEQIQVNDDAASPVKREGVGQVAQSLSLVGSLSAMVATETRQAMEMGAKLEEAEDKPDFDPASLRFDGRQVYSESSSHRVDRNVIDSIPPTPPRQSSQRSASGFKNFAVFNSHEAMLAGFPDVTRERSVIGFRVTVGEDEARLSGLLAPNAPSHRNLWASRHKQRSKASQHDHLQEDVIKEEEEEEDEAKEKGKGKAETEQGQAGASSEDSDSQHAAWQERFAKRSDAQSVASSKSVDDSSIYARSVPIQRGAGPGRRSISTTVHRDKTSGFDLEPKTSLPYQEKMLTPSLLKATRKAFRSTSGQGSMASKRPSLGAISDASEQSSSLGTSQQGESASSAAVASATKSIPQRPPLESPRASFKYAIPQSLPGSVQKGFDVPRRADELVDARSAAAVATHVPGLPMPTRTPYTPPPPPTSYNLRLEPDEKHRPATLQLPALVKSDASADDEAGTNNLDKALEFMHTLEKLKLNKRTGWYHHRITHPESIADHMYRMGVLSMLLPNGTLDIGKCVQLCLVHDIAESLVGDLTPLDNVPKEEKHRREHEAVLHLVHDLLGSSVAALRLESLWNEYEARETPESRAVKDLDRFELALQAVEYERAWNTTDLQPFFDGCSGDISHSRIKLWMHQLAREREHLWSKTPFKYTQQWPSTAERE